MRSKDQDTTTSIGVTLETWKRLNTLKQPGDSFNTVIARLLDKEDVQREDAESD